jgi:hypothetical protein
VALDVVVRVRGRVGLPVDRHGAVLGAPFGGRVEDVTGDVVRRCPAVDQVAGSLLMVRPSLWWSSSESGDTTGLCVGNTSSAVSAVRHSAAAGGGIVRTSPDTHYSLRSTP